jgi:hypothetical protein
VVLYMGLILSSNLPRRASKTVVNKVAIFCVIWSVFLRFSSRTDNAARDSSRSAACEGLVRIDIPTYKQHLPDNDPCPPLCCPYMSTLNMLLAESDAECSKIATMSWVRSTNLGSETRCWRAGVNLIVS